MENSFINPIVLKGKSSSVQRLLEHIPANHMINVQGKLPGCVLHSLEQSCGQIGVFMYFMFKKVIVVFLIAVSILTFTGCGQNSDDGETTIIDEEEAVNARVAKPFL